MFSGQRRFRINSACLLPVIAALVILSGCRPAPRWVSTADIEGKWLSTTNPRAVLSFESDGSVQLTDVPGSLVGEGAGLSSPIDRSYTGKCQWVLDRNVGHVDAVGRIVLRTTTQSVGTLYAGRDSRGIDLYYWEGDPDAGKSYHFRRAAR